VRSLVQRVTLALGSLVATLVAWLNLQNQTPWPLAMTRAAIAFAIVVAAGAVIGLVLMRTALRRHYETWLSRTRTHRARVER
jgi:hypothetical protein